MQKIISHAGAIIAGAMLTVPGLTGSTTLYAQGVEPDLVKGKAQFVRCQSCHSNDAAAPRGIGPNLAGVVGRPAGKQSGFKYTPGLAAANFIWTPAKLDLFLTKPRDVVPGTTMVFAGIPDAASRQALIAYLAASNK